MKKSAGISNMSAYVRNTCLNVASRVDRNKYEAKIKRAYTIAKTSSAPIFLTVSAMVLSQSFKVISIVASPAAHLECAGSTALWYGPCQKPDRKGATCLTRGF